MAIKKYTKTVGVNEIVLDPSIQPRVGGLDGNHVRTLEEAIDGLPPIVVVVLLGAYVLLDGAHRLAALQNLSRLTAEVIVYEVSDDTDLHSLAFELNASHGRPLSLDDRRAEAEQLLLCTPTNSDREIGRHCGLSQPTVAKIRGGLEKNAKIERTTERVGKGGYRYEVDQSQEVDDVTRLRKSFERFFIYVANGVESEWWDETAIVEMLLNTCEEDQLDELLEALKDAAAVFASVAQVFETAIS